MDTPGLLSLVEASQASRVSTKTLRRRLQRGDFPGAYQDPEQRGAWLIPVADLLAAGLSLVPEVVEDRPAALGEVEQLRAEVVSWRERALVAEAVAEERGAALEAERLALRALGEATSTGTQRRRWRRRAD